MSFFFLFWNPEKEKKTTTTVRLGTHSTVPNQSSMYDIGTMTFEGSEEMKRWMKEWEDEANAKLAENRKKWEEHDRVLAEKEKWEKEEKEILQSNQEMLTKARQNMFK
jgi:arsenate reductase-like glutaredoxin family protein